MAQKLILLILIIPIIVMVVLFAFTETVSILVDVPVSGLRIIEENPHVYLDLDKNETYSLEYAVYPTTANNKAVSIVGEAVDGEPTAKLEFIPDEGQCTVVPRSAGAARVVVTTQDGSFKESIIVHVRSTKLQSIDASAEKTELEVGEKTAINTLYYPSSPSNTLLSYTSSDPKVIEVDRDGNVHAVGRGSATVTVISDFNTAITDEIVFTVRNRDAMDLGKTEITGFATAGSIPISISSDDAITASAISYKFTYPDGTEVPASVITASVNINGASVSVDYTFTDKSFAGDIIASISFTSGGDTITKKCTLSVLSDIVLSFNSGAAFETVTGQTTSIPFTLLPKDASVTYEVSASNGNVSVRMSSNGRLVLESSAAGVTTVTLTATSELDPTNKKTVSCDVVVKPDSMNVVESGKQYGIEGIFAIGGYEYSYEGGTPALIKSAQGTSPFALHYSTSSELGAGFAENLSWHSSSPEVTVDKNGVISFVNDTFSGNVEIYASFSYGGIEARTAPYTVTCIADGVNVYSYTDLYLATTAGKPVVLMSDVKEGFGYVNGELKYSTIETTYDKTYYTNVDRGDETKIKVLLEFKNDLYGNGHVINAHEVTYKLTDGPNGEKLQDKNALFGGPLNFVMIREENGATVSVKAQDNICFALYEGVTVRNVELRGCDLEADGSGKIDLTHLNYIGTTVEVLGDDVTIAYSRLTNGRTVLRAFGDIADSEKQITVNVQNSVLSGAREFIMRLGSNRYSTESPQTGADGEYIPPALPGDASSDAYNSKNDYHSFTPEEKAAYDGKFINTFVNVKNSVFKDAGIFAIGMDSHFASGALDRGESMKESFPSVGKYLVGWKGLARTSYGVKLSFFGDVELYNWKDIEDIDSSTLIEIEGSSAFSSIALNVNELIEKVPNKNIVSKRTEGMTTKTYVHAGIAFFGGGKNYSVFDSEKNIGLGRYDVSLTEVGRPELEIAAGTEPFRFYLYDASSSFTPEAQKAKLASDDAYSCIYKK